MLKGRSKSFAPKSVPRVPKRKGQDDAPEPPAKRVSMTPDRPSEPTPEILRVEKRKAQDDVAEPPTKRVPITSDQLSVPAPQIPRNEVATSVPDTTPVPVQAASVAGNIASSTASARATSPSANTGLQLATQDGSTVEDVVHSGAPARESSPNANARSGSQLAAQDTSQIGNAANTSTPGRETPAHTNAAPESENVVSVPARSDEAPPAPSNPPPPYAIEGSVLPSIERSDNVAVSHNERVRSSSPTPARRTSAEPSSFRYPSPENIVRLVESEAIGNPPNMGPPGGQLGAAGDVAAIVRTGEIVQMATLNPDGTTGGIVEPASGTEKGKKKKKVVRRKRVQAGEDDGDDARATIDMGLTKARRQDNKTSRKLKKKKAGPENKRKDREETPSDAEEEIIDPTMLTMQDLCKDLRIGKKFSRHDEIKQRIIKKKQEVQRNRLRENHPELITILDAEDEDDEARFAAMTSARRAEAAQSGTNSDAARAESSQTTTLPEPAANAGNPGVRYQIIDGNIVLNESSTVLDRQKEAETARANMEEVEENEFSKAITSGTYMKREKSNSWDAIATEQFYKALGQYGTDFQTIAKLFPNRSRRQIKLKFNAEERKNAAKITRYLTQPKKAMDLDAFERISGLKLESVQEIEADHAREAAIREKTLAAQAEELAAADRAKKAQIAETSEKRMSERDATSRILASVEMGSDGEDEAPRRSAGESSKENAAPATGKGKRKAAPKKPRKNKHSHNAGGDEVIVLGTIE